MHDGFVLEKYRIPTAVICTTIFLHEAHQQRAALGMRDLEPVAITHPLSTISDEEIEMRVDEATVQIHGVLMGK